ncbi:unnamed protein product, partial [Timema podura]|nr:unnamed protein product [Timema podura]
MSPLPERLEFEFWPAVRITPLQQALSHKDAGNKLFKANKFIEAIECYNAAIEICPTDKTQDLATFFQNRAATYEQL